MYHTAVPVTLLRLSDRQTLSESWTGRATVVSDASDDALPINRRVSLILSK